MDLRGLISVETFCLHYNVEIGFVVSLHDFDLVEIIEIEQVKYIAVTELAEAEKIVRLRNELDINISGIDTVLQLLRKVKDMQQEISGLKSRLRLYEDEI